MKKRFGVGIMDASYKVTQTSVINGKTKQTWTCPAYRAWVGMLERCYSAKSCNPSYQNASVCEEWHTFSAFAQWMFAQQYEGLALDKDLLGNDKLYSPETCVFVPQAINNLFLGCAKKPLARYMLGVSVHGRSGLYTSRVSVGVEHSQTHLGYFKTEYDAHRAWQLKKLEVVRRVIDEYRPKSFYNQMVETALQQRLDQLVFDIENNAETTKL